MILLDIHHSSRSTVMMLLAVMDPIASRLRKVKRLTRRTYLIMASDQPHVCSYLYLELSVSFQGPNWCWHIDGYDKLKPFGFPIHVCIDGVSSLCILFHNFHGVPPDFHGRSFGWS